MSDTNGTFESDTGGTFGVIYSQESTLKTRPSGLTGGE